MMSQYSLRRNQFDNSDPVPNRQGQIPASRASNYSTHSNTASPVYPTRNGALNLSPSINQTGHKRGSSDAIDVRGTYNHDDGGSHVNNPEILYKNSRKSLRPPHQAPTNSSPNAKRHSSYHARQPDLDRFPQHHSEDLINIETGKHSPDEGVVSHPQFNNGVSSHHQQAFRAPDLQELQKSSTSHLRTLSKFAQSEDSEDFSLAAPTPSVVGLHNRRQLKRTDSVATHHGQGAVSTGKAYGWGERNWMDKQRQFLQAYEYLCHIGEAKEWIEDIIHKPIPPIVQLEEALRDGVTLAEIVQAFHEEKTLRIFKNAKLQYKHSDNIVLFFRFLEEIGLPDLFRFELIDLYEKKNTPKVIYCIHALSWLLYRKGMVDFRIGNLVGQLEFDHHELERTQRGLDKAGVSMPSFSGMGANFGAEPVETEDQRVDRELKECGTGITDVQSLVRGAMVRIRLGDMMQDLWDSEEIIIDLQSRMRGDWARQVINYRISMKQFATKLQTATRGFLARTDKMRQEQVWKTREKEVLMIQSLIRAKKARTEVKSLKSVIHQRDSGIRELQASIRGGLAREKVLRDTYKLQQEEQKISTLQAGVRSLLLRSKQATLQRRLSDLEQLWTKCQASIRARHVRESLLRLRQELRSHQESVAGLQAHIRGAIARENFHGLKLSLIRQSSGLIPMQSNLRGFVCRYEIKEQRRVLEKHTSKVLHLQSLVRGGLLRERISQTLAELDHNQEEILQLQSLARAMFLRGHIGEFLEELYQHETMITELQASIRAGAVRRRFEDKKRHFNENMQKVVKIQSVVRAKIQGQAYKSLTAGKNPPVGTLKGFVHLLNDSDFDFDEEIEFERLRKTVVQHVRQNELADQYITQLDLKIALLVKNKITLDEVIKHQRHFGGHVGALLPNSDIASKDPSDLKALNKTSRKKLERYQELFFLLQTQPQYMSRLFRRFRESGTAEKECERIKHLIMGLFGYAQKRREEYYLTKLIVRSIKEEVDHANSLQDYLRTTSFWNKLFAAYIKSPRDRKFLRDTLGSLIKDNFVDNRELDLESDPLQIYLSAINNEELRTGRRSQRDPSVLREVAIRDQETRATFIAHMQDLRDITDQFFLYLEDCLHRMPFGVRFIAQQSYEHLITRFPGDDPVYILQLVGQWLWRSYLQPALLEPEKFGVADRAMTQEQKRNLAEVAKVLNQATLGREFGGENIYLQPLNNYLRESVQRFSSIWEHIITIPPAEEHYDIDEFNDLYAKTKPSLYIKLADIFSIHQFLSSEISWICPNQDDTLRDILRELGSVQSNESELRGVSSGEISLTLSPKLLNAEDPDADIKTLFTETKRCVLYIIRIQSGTDLLDILVKQITPEDEEKWNALVREELGTGLGRRGAYAEASTLLDIGQLSYPDLKQIALENILQLESIGRLTRSNQFQDLLNTIAVDIRTKHRRRLQRQRELENVRTTLARLNEQAVYLEQQLKTYNDYIEQAMVTLQSKKGKKRFLMPFTKQWDHERELQRSGRSFKFGSYKYSARNLADRGVLVSWQGYTERQWDRVDLTISSNAVGVFTIDGSSGNMMIPGANAQIPLDELLQAQFNNTQFMEFFEGALRVNVNLFLHLIMKKFYNE